MEHVYLGNAYTQKVEAGGGKRSSKAASAKKPQINFPKCVGRHHQSAHTDTRGHVHRGSNIQISTEQVSQEGLRLETLSWSHSHSIPSPSGLQMIVHRRMVEEYVLLPLSTDLRTPLLSSQTGATRASPFPMRGALKHQDVSRL